MDENKRSFMLSIHNDIISHIREVVSRSKKYTSVSHFVRVAIDKLMQHENRED